MQVRKALLALPALALALGLATDVQAAKLSDLIKQTPKLYCPSQLLPGKTATFTVQGKPGTMATLVLSPKAEGMELPNGVTLRVGKPLVERSATIPASGVLEIPVEVPDDVDLLGDRQFVEAFVWSSADQLDAQPADIMNNSSSAANDNAIVVSAEADAGSTMVVPGDPNLSNLLRTVNTLTDANSDPRKKQLLDTGDINRNRLIDQTLNVMPSSR